MVVGEGLRRKLEVGMAAVEGRAPSVGIEPATSTSMKACKMVYRSTKQTSGRLYVVIVWHHLCRHHHHRPETKLQQASCPHGGTFIAPEGLLDGYCPPPPPPRLHYSSPVLSGTVLARALLEGVHEGLSSSLICIITDLEGTNLMEEIDLAEETSDAVVSALASGVSMGVEGRINVSSRSWTRQLSWSDGCYSGGANSEEKGPVVSLVVLEYSYWQGPTGRGVDPCSNQRD